MIDALKTVNRKIKIKSKLRKFNKFKFKENDSDFLYVKNLREKGLCLDPDFLSKSASGKKIINQFNSINQSTLLDIFNENQNKKSVKSFKSYLTRFFNKQDLIDFANQDLILREVRQYFGFEPYIRYISVWLDYSTNDNQPKDTQIFHRDSDDVHLIKVFFYLNDVNINNGPFQYIKYSHKKSWIDYKNDFLLNKFAGNIFSCEAKKGTLILCDTNGYHKGLTLKEKNYRVMLTVNYTSQSPRWGKLEKIIN